MKIVVIGGGGVRTPLLMPALARRQDQLDLGEVVLVDRDEQKLSLMAPLIRYAADQADAHFKLTWTCDLPLALPGADVVITTIRVGGERARVLDERAALDRGVLGQETTGAGGFAMALRTIPAMMGIAEQVRRLCPDAWLLNFTNPAGLVAQALTLQFPELNIVGICDTPIGLHRQVAAVFGRSVSEVPIRFCGLNHLSWMFEALVDGENVIPRLLAEPALLAQVTELSLFAPDLLRLLGSLPNEYLYFYYYRDQAVANIRAAGETRGEQVQRLGGLLLRDLQDLNPSQHPDQAWQRYHQYLDSRHGSYLAAETAGGMQREAEEQAEEKAEEGEGYAGVALDILTASRDRPTRLVVNVPSRGTVPGMQEDDVVETVCLCDASGVHPLPTGPIPPDELLLMQQVKRYERLAVEAVRTHSRDCAVEALMAHPLIGSYPLACSLVDTYLDAHREYVGEWAA